MMFLTRRKSIDTLLDHAEHHQLKKTLSWPHLIALGVGAIVGTGIYTLIGVGAGLAGPAVILSFVIAGAVCACAALAYAEMSTMMPAAGSAYTYSYAVLGEGLAWIVGWSLILEYTVVCAAVAVGWSGHAAEFLPWLPKALLAGPWDPTNPGLINLPAVFISLVVTALLVIGTRESATVNIVLVMIKISALALFVALAAPAFNPDHFHPFMTRGFSGVEPDGTKIGVMAAASIMFFAFYGFDAVSTAAEETKNPGRNLTIGIVGSMLICTLIYMVVAGAAIGALAVPEFAAAAAPLVNVLKVLKHPLAGEIIAGAAVLALPTVIMAFMYGQSRIFFVMARDGLLPMGMAKVNAKTGTPVIMTVFTGVVAAVIAGAVPLADIAAVANAGTLCAFIAALICMMILRVRDPGRARTFRTPLWPVVGVAGIAGCLYLFTTLPDTAIKAFFIWNGVGVVAYLLYGMHQSRLAKAA
ncbi:amino acid permease [Caulobacter ginsengisoli]|nr:amino acid permease [Caulobacter ginsengisoli]